MSCGELRGQSALVGPQSATAASGQRAVTLAIGGVVLVACPSGGGEGSSTRSSRRRWAATWRGLAGGRALGGRRRGGLSCGGRCRGRSPGGNRRVRAVGMPVGDAVVGVGREGVGDQVMSCHRWFLLVWLMSVTMSCPGTWRRRIRCAVSMNRPLGPTQRDPEVRSRMRRQAEGGIVHSRLRTTRVGRGIRRRRCRGR